MQTAGDQKQLIDKINQLNILRESNATLREEAESNLTQFKKMSAKVAELNKQLAPLQDRVRDLEADAEVKDSMNKTLEEDAQRWKARAQQILERYERIDPVEHQKLKDECAALAASKTETEAKLQAAEQAVEKERSDMQTRIVKLQTTAAQWKKRAEISAAKMTELDQKNKAMLESTKKAPAPGGGASVQELVSFGMHFPSGAHCHVRSRRRPPRRRTRSSKRSSRPSSRASRRRPPRTRSCRRRPSRRCALW